MELETLNESELRKKIIIPLMQAMGFNDVIEYHGTNEKGKDIIGWKSDELKGRLYYAVIAKAGDIHGSVGKTNSASEVLYQVRQAFSSPYRDIYGLSEVKIHRCIVITNGSISSSAIESISGDIGSSNLERNLDFIDVNKLKLLVDKYLPTKYGIIGNIVYTYDIQIGAYYFYVNPKRNPNGGPQCVKTRQLQIDGSFLINIDYNFDGTVHGFEVIEFRSPEEYREHEIDPKSLLSELKERAENWSLDGLSIDDIDE